MSNDKPVDAVLDGPARPFGETSSMVVRDAGMMDVAISRAAQEVQAAMVVAKKMPRDPIAAYNRIMKACQRPTLAEDATYAFPRGGTTVSGPSIRLAEVLAQNWGNIDSGVVELEQRDGESTVMAYAWDLETNTKSTKIFTVKHIRSKRGGNVQLDDPRDIYEMTANQGARRLRACILAVIPGDIVDAAVRECDNTLAKGHGAVPLEDRLRRMIPEFEKIGVTQDMIEKRLGHKVATTTEIEFVSLKKIYKSIQDNMQPVESFFEVTAAGGQDAKRPASAKGEAKPHVAPTPKVEVPAVPFDATKPPVEEVFRLCKESDVDPAQLLAWAKHQKIAGKVIEELPQLSDAKLTNLLQNWAGILPEVKKIAV